MSNEIQKRVKKINCLICHHAFDWNDKVCPNCSWEVVDFIGDEEHMANVHLRPEREAWVTKKNYKVSDFSLKGYFPALLEAMKNQFELEDFDENYKIEAFYREWCEDDVDFNARIAQKPVKLGVAGWIPKKYNPKTGDFPILIQWDTRITDSKQADTEDKRYFVNIPKDQAKKVFESNATPPIYLHLNFDDLKQIHAIKAYLIANQQVFEISPQDHIDLLEIQADEENNLPDCTLDLKPQEVAKQQVAQTSPQSVRIIDVITPYSPYSNVKIEKYYIELNELIRVGTKICNLRSSSFPFTKNIESFYSGKVIEILKKQGDFVKTGDVIARIRVEA